MKKAEVKLALISTLLITLLLVVSVPFSKATDGGPQLQWAKTYPRPASMIQNVSARHYDSGSCFIQTSDHGYAIVGNTDNYAFYFQYGVNEHDYSGIMIKTDSSGNMQWNKTNSAFLNASAIFQKQDHGYFMVLEGGRNLRLDSQGNIQSNKTLGMPLSGVQQTSDGGYVFVSANGNGAIMTKTDANGDLLWNKTLYVFPNSFSSTIAVSNIATSFDGNYLIAGWSSVNARLKGAPNLWILKVDLSGNLLFSKGFSYDPNAPSLEPGVHIDQNAAAILGIFVTATKDGGCLLAGTAGLDTIIFPFLLKLSSNGDGQWVNRSYTTGLSIDVSFSSAIQTSDGEYIAVGATPPNSGNNVVLIIKAGANGDPQWNQMFTSSVNFAAASSILVTNEDGYIVLGSLDGNVWLAKFGS